MEIFRATTDRSEGYPVTAYEIVIKDDAASPAHPQERAGGRNYPWRVSRYADKNSYPYPAG